MDDHQIFKFMQSSQESPPSLPIPSFDQEEPPSSPFPNPTANLSGGNGSINIVGNQEEMEMDDHHQIFKLMQSTQEETPSSPIPSFDQQSPASPPIPSIDQEEPPSLPIPNLTANLSGGNGAIIIFGNQGEMKMDDHEQILKFLQSFDQETPNSPIPSPSSDQEAPPPSSPIPTEYLSCDDYGSIDIRILEQEEMNMWEFSKKLILWNTRNFTPISSHDQLEPIMANIGFFPRAGLISITSPPLPPPPPTDPANPNPNPESNSNSNSDSNSVTVLWREYYYHSSVPPLHQNLGDKFEVVATPCPRLPYPNIVGLHLLTYHAFLIDINFYRPIFSSLYHIFQVRGMRLQEEDRNKVWRRMAVKNLKFVHCEPSFDFSARKNDIMSRILKSPKTRDKRMNDAVFVQLDDIITKTQPPTNAVEEENEEAKSPVVSSCSCSSTSD